MIQAEMESAAQRDLVDTQLHLMASQVWEMLSLARKKAKDLAHAIHQFCSLSNQPQQLTASAEHNIAALALNKFRLT